MAVTKTVAPVYINYAVKKGGLTILGENRAQELCEKYDDYLLKREHIHFIGHLQTNKVRQIIDKVSMIQSVDSLKLAKEIDLQAKKHHLSMDVLLEVNIGREETKSGVLPENLPDLLCIRIRTGEYSYQRADGNSAAESGGALFQRDGRTVSKAEERAKVGCFITWNVGGLSAGSSSRFYDGPSGVCDFWAPEIMYKQGHLNISRSGGHPWLRVVL